MGGGQIVGILLAVASGVLIGSSFVFKKKGLLRSQAGHVAGEGVAYLKSVRIFMLYLPSVVPFSVYLCVSVHGKWGSFGELDG
jgi:magnesium transporter